VDICYIVNDIVCHHQHLLDSLQSGIYLENGIIAYILFLNCP